MNNLFGQDIIKSIGFDEGEIIKNIMELHCPDGFDVDPCYSIGRFYDDFGIKKPKQMFDIKPQAKGVVQSNANSLPIEPQSVNSIMFDPPFLASCGDSMESKDENVNIIAKRFSVFKTMAELWKWYDECLAEFSRILKPGGVLVFKNQDTVSSAKQYFSHVRIMNKAVSEGFYPKDLFILLAKNRIIGGNHAIQQHARKFHCYYWVFEKKPCTINYNIAV
jgi:Predicted DNA modification methylase